MYKSYPHLRVLQVVPSLNVGGVERGTLEIAKALISSSAGSFVASNGGKLVEQLQATGTQHLQINVKSKNPIIIIWNIWRLKTIINEYNINIIHARSRAPAWSAYFAAKLTGIKFVTTFHGQYSIGNFLKKFYNSIMTRGDRVIAVSRFIYEHILDNYSIDGRKLLIINRGVDVSYFNADSISKERISNIAHALQLPSLKPRNLILMPSRFSRWKGHLYLLKILSHIQNHNFLCYMVGKAQNDNHEYIDEVKATIIKYNLENKVFIHEIVNDMPALYANFNIVVSPSLKPEAFGRTITEAQAMGKMVIATEHGGASTDAIEDKISGFHIPIDSAEDAAEVFLQVFELDKEQIKDISNNALDSVMQSFTLQSMCLKTLEVYNMVLLKNR